jgi:hypothetical protein
MCRHEPVGDTVNVVLVHGGIDTLEVHVLGLRRGVVERQRPEGANFGHVSQDRGPEASAKIGLGVILSPLFLIVGTRQAVEKLLFRKIRGLLHHAVLVGPQCDLGHLLASRPYQCEVPEISDRVRQRALLTEKSIRERASSQR